MRHTDMMTVGRMLLPVLVLLSACAQTSGATLDGRTFLSTSVTKDGIAKLRVYRYEVFFDYDLRVQLSGSSADSSARFGIVDWSRGRDVRASGFYGHYTTYAEVVQLIGSLALGLLLLVPGSLFARNRLLLGLTLALLSVGLLLTVTRASWIGFAVSAASTRPQKEPGPCPSPGQFAG